MKAQCSLIHPTSFQVSGVFIKFRYVHQRNGRSLNVLYHLNNSAEVLKEALSTDANKNHQMNLIIGDMLP